MVLLQVEGTGTRTQPDQPNGAAARARDGSPSVAPSAVRASARFGGADAAGQPADRVAQLLLGVEPRGPGLDDEAEQPRRPADAPRGRLGWGATPAFAGRGRAPCRRSASAGSAGGMPSSTEARPFSAALSVSQLRSTSSASATSRPGEHVRVPVHQLVHDARGDVVDREPVLAARRRPGRGSTPGAAGRRAPRAGACSRAPRRPARRSPRGSRGSPRAGTSPATGGSARGPTGTRCAAGPSRSPGRAAGLPGRRTSRAAPRPHTVAAVHDGRRERRGERLGLGVVGEPDHVAVRVRGRAARPPTRPGARRPGGRTPRRHGPAARRPRTPAGAGRRGDRAPRGPATAARGRPAGW